MAEQQHHHSLTAELQELLLVALGAVPGALLRWQVALHLGDRHVLVNVVGAGVLGLLVGLPAAPRRQLLVGIGFCGSLTTFSSWMVDAMQLISAGQIAEALGLIGLTLGLGVGAAALGFWLGQRLRLLKLPRSEP
jgi:CrcB protein